MKIQKPEWKWYFSLLPFTRGARDYKKDRIIYEKQFLNEHEAKIYDIRQNQQMYINSLSALLIMIITTLWTVLPPLVELPNWLQWANMGMEGFGSSNWGNQVFLTIVPASAGTALHNFHKFVPSKKLKLVVDLIIKIIPVIILLLVCYLWLTEKHIFQIKKAYKIYEKSKLLGNNEIIEQIIKTDV